MPGKLGQRRGGCQGRLVTYTLTKVMSQQALSVTQLTLPWTLDTI